MADIQGTAADEVVDPDFVSPTVTGGLPSAAADNISMAGGNDDVDAGAGADIIDLGDGNDLFRWGVNDDSDDLVGGAGFDELRIEAGSASDFSSIELYGPIGQFPATFLYRLMGGSTDGGVDFTGIERIRIESGDGLGHVMLGTSILASSVQEILIEYLDPLVRGDLLIQGDGQFSVRAEGSGTLVSMGTVRVLTDAIPNRVSFTGGGGNSIYDFSASNLSQHTVAGLQGAEYVIAGAAFEGFTAGFGAIDTLDYSRSPAAVFLLRNETDTIARGYGGWAEGDSFDGVEQIIGSPFGDYVRVVVAHSITIHAGGGDDQAIGGNVDDRLFGETGNDRLEGFFGNDLLDGGTGADVLRGGPGSDTYYVDSDADVIIENVGEGNDRVAVAGSYTLASGVSVERLEALTLTDTSAANLAGNAFNQTIVGNNGANMLTGGGGNDHLIGAGGNDTFVGNTSASTMEGGTGNDVYFVRDASDGVIEISGQGADRIAAATSYVLLPSSEIETLETVSLAATTAINLTGNLFQNLIVGNNGANVLDGKGGMDTLVGAGGADTFAFTTALAANNVDRIEGFVSGTDRIGLDDAVFAGIAPGALAAGAFFVGSQAADGDDRIVYDTATGALFYDPDGTGAAAQVQFATLAGSPALAGSDFVLL